MRALCDSSGVSRFRKVATTSLVTITLASICSGWQPPQPRPPELEAILSSAQALPTEYMADIILGVLETGSVTDVRWKKELLEAVFARSRLAVQPYSRHDVGGYNDTASGRLGAAFDKRLDALSIQCRVVELMLRVSPVRAGRCSACWQRQPCHR